MLKITITGDTPSKKNGKQIVYSKKLNRPFTISSKNHSDWHTQAMYQLLGKRPVQGNIERLEMILYPKTKRKGDLDNKAASILDLLVDKQIIEDDSWYTIPELNVKFGGVSKDNPRCEITIYEKI